VTTGVWLAAAFWAPLDWIGGAQVRDLMILTAVLIVVRTFDSGIAHIVRAQQRSLAGSMYGVIKKYLTVAAVVGVLLYLVPGIKGFFIATVVVEAVTTIGFMVYILRGTRISSRLFSFPLLFTMMAYGLPMLAQELAAMLLLQGDRYVIQSLLGPEHLGIYSAGYNLTEYVKAVLVLSFGTAVIPMYTKIYVDQGRAATKEFVEKSLHFYVIAGVAMCFGVSAVAKDLITLLASEKFAEAATVIPWVSFAMVLEGANPLLGAGIFLRKQSWIIMLLMIVAAAISLGLNFVLVPPFGIVGAAMSSCVSMLLLSAGMFIAGRREVSTSLPVWHLVKMVVAGAIAWWLATRVHTDWLIVRIGLRLIVGAVSLSVLVVLLDPMVRAQVMGLLRRRRLTA
jgi:O-antigen/teichoic acid export membrane protein